MVTFGVRMVSPRDDTSSPELKEANNMLREALDTLVVKKELLSDAFTANLALAEANQKYWKCHIKSYIDRADSFEKVTKRKPGTSGHDEKCKSLEKKLAASKDNVQCLRKKLRKTTAVVEAIEKKKKCRFGKRICRYESRA